MRVSVTALLPDLAAGHAEQTASGEGGNLGLAVYRALRLILKSPHVRGRRIHSLNLSVVRVPDAPKEGGSK